MLRSWLGNRIAGATLVTVPVLAVLTSACGGGSAAAGPGATVPQAASTSTTSSDPYAIPNPITVAYVQHVLDALEAVNTDAMRIVLAQRSLVPDAAQRMRAVNTSSSFNQQTMILLNQIDTGLSNYRIPAGAIKDHVIQVLTANPSCVFAEVTRDYSALEKNPEPSPTTYVVLRARVHGDDASHLNPTPWVIDFFGYNKSGTPVANPCTPGT